MRRTKPEKRVTKPDIRYNSVTVQFIINRFMKNGKKSLANRLMYEAMDIIKAKTSRDPMDVLDEALKNVGPIMEVRPRRVGGATYQVPMEVPTHRRMTLAMRWIIDAARKRSGRSFSEKLAGEIMDGASSQGAAFKKREEAHRMAEANRAFSHYRV
ncbi:MAG: 30S ribosomal protein S7 [Anaerolineaceae bacterium]|nr:30S ribosomal protein S7 [Anaerolineaceae bacterium]